MAERPLTDAQRDALRTLGDDWGYIPLSTTMRTLNALERRGLIETRILPRPGRCPRKQVRRRPYTASMRIGG